MAIIHHFNRKGFYIEDVRQHDGLWIVEAYKMERSDAEEKAMFLPTIDSSKSPAHVVEDALVAYDRLRGPQVFITYYADPGVKRGDYRATMPQGVETAETQPHVVSVPVSIDEVTDAMLADLGIPR